MYGNGNIGIPGSRGTVSGIIMANRTGANSVVGGCYFKDLKRSQAESTSTATAQENFIPVTTSLITDGILVVGTKILADNERGYCVEGFGVEVDLLVESTTDIGAGDSLKPVNAQAYMVKATVATDKVYARALEARTANDTGLIRAILYSVGTGL